MSVIRPGDLYPLLALLLPACDLSGAGGPQPDPQNLCGPTTAIVASVIDGDTIVLDSGQKVRYLMIDTPEITKGKHDCYGEEARQYNEDLVLGQEVTLTYDEECKDTYGRLLAYVEAPDGELNTLLVERGFACVLIIPPNGSDREAEFMSLELEARQKHAGLWGVCAGEVTCD
ncbi:MAG: thermonuclease family protein [Nannocystis sp.]|uniref:thermonuclease family protein n=1 Tax=Nannocystis sp. TaxID=1962667 RepID=UPI002426DA38|nr:thermonuclease family protein [Nannocystis sp.]MBK9758045.1 thermonuclease family protein [Nannocystis sp.]